ncbi:unnamed protein product [Lactuca virosa]|uniref:Transmembrane protein n=1 Tax=Lactuca virosa TaxID=75947 RepID=A0AAU9LFY0_9ASTR|nr:unnamed protein product [Lactuca virosa]
MAHLKLVLFCFFFSGILIFRPTTARPIVKQSREIDQTLPALAPDSASLVPAESPDGSDLDHDLQTKKHHHSSVAGGGVIVGGLVTIAFAAVYCYIRVTRKREGEHH